MAGMVPSNRNPRDEMNYYRQSPWQNINNMLDTFFGNDSAFMKGFDQNFKIDVKNTEKEYLVQADLPGVKKEDVKIGFNNGTLTISVQKENNVDESKDDYIHRERNYSSMSRSMYLDNVEADSIKAKLEEGVLTITIPKSEVAKTSKDITID